MPVHRLDSNPPLVRAPNTPASPPSPAPRVAPSPARTSHPRTKIRAPACEPPRIISQSRSPSSNHPRASPTSRLRARPPESSEFDRLKTVSKSRVALDPFARARATSSAPPPVAPTLDRRRSRSPPRTPSATTARRTPPTPRASVAPTTPAGSSRLNLRSPLARVRGRVRRASRRARGSTRAVKTRASFRSLAARGERSRGTVCGAVARPRRASHGGQRGTGFYTKARAS